MLYLGILLLFAALLLGAYALVPQQRDLSGRIRVLQNPGANTKQGLRDADEMNKSFVVRVLLPLADRFGKFVPTPQGSIDAARKEIQGAGLTGKVSPTQIISLQYMLLIALPIVGVLLTLGSDNTLQKVAAPLIMAVLGYRLPIGIIAGRASKRRHEIQKGLPFTLDLISISVEAGVAMDGALRIVADKTTGPLTDEIVLTLREIQLGKGREEALTDLANRTGVDDLKSFITAINYIGRLGGSLVDVIRIQAEAMRIKRRQRAEEKAMKTPVKIMIPLVLFIFPSMFIVILGPAGLQLYVKMSTSEELKQKGGANAAPGAPGAPPS
ncbi:MAG: type II secretion system F family protein [Candidatus Methylacidiphilales bacterium]|nr:type II secretion system F family protein [Candidatus Methylacidiphilales bacterium]